MKKYLLIMFLALPLAFSSGLTYAKDYGYQNNPGKGKAKGHYKHKATAVPEIDAASAALAIALMGGVVSIAREKRRRKS